MSASIYIMLPAQQGPTFFINDAHRRHLHVLLQNETTH